MLRYGLLLRKGQNMYQELMKQWLEREGGLDVLKMQTATSATPLIEFVEWLDTRLLTTDAPEMTVGDSGSVSKHSTDDTDGRWECQECN